jgi:CRP/FNR family cyclic AMP-dependent transcriptional regulator
MRSPDPFVPVGVPMVTPRGARSLNGPVSGRSETCRLLREDPALGESIPPERREQAMDECTARETTIPVGRWKTSTSALRHGGIGLLVLGGLLVRRVGIEGRFGAELLGEGDLLRPWEGDDEVPMLPLATGWRVLEPTRLAILDEEFMRRMANHPELGGALIGRAIGRSRHLAVNMAIVHQARVDVRLHMLMWHMAARWGRVGSEGVMVPLRLTHAVLAELVAARRPTVTSALSQLSRVGLLTSTDAGWLLYGDPPGEFNELGAASAAG